MIHDPRNYNNNNTQQLLSAQAQAQQLNQQKHELAHNLEMGPERLGLDFLLDGTQRVPKIPNGVNGAVEQGGFQLGGKEEREGSVHQRSSSGSSYGNGPAPGSGPGNDVMGHAAPIRNGPPTCPLDSLLLDFLHSRQQQAADGVSTPKLVGPAYPSVSSLLNPAKASQSHPLSKVFTVRYPNFFFSSGKSKDFSTRSHRP